ncbi:unnamed protein product [Mytilus edulis]|uniref:Uncharacterized protein n=1 Tax=Mytilus edulis TaxID=6550 RepID=A0A8S3V4A1_MYTED|nr:unnamed protein product [Mytilus edulis]
MWSLQDIQEAPCLSDLAIYSTFHGYRVHKTYDGGFANDGKEVPEANRKTREQKVSMLELMLGQIANYCPIISRNTIVKNSTSIDNIWQTIRLHYGFQITGAHFVDFDAIHYDPGERPEDLYQRLMAFIEDSLLRKDMGITHHDEDIEDDEELSPTLENLLILTWLRLIHPELPKLIKQRYGTELRARTLASIKPEISQALESLLEELRTTEDAKSMRAAVKRFRFPLKLQIMPTVQISRTTRPSFS